MATKEKSPLTLKQRRERNMKRERLAIELSNLKHAAALLALFKTANALNVVLETIALEMSETNQK